MTKHNLNQSIGGHYDFDLEGVVFGDIPLLFYIVSPQPNVYQLCRQSFDDKDDGASIQLDTDQNDANYIESVLFLLVTHPDINVEQLRSLVNSHPPLKEIVDRVSVARYTIRDHHIRRVFCALTVGGS
jgi:hypothetical protein